MALQPSLSYQIVAGNPQAPHTLEFFYDYVCPFSAKSSGTLDRVLKPLFAEGGKYGGKVKVIVRLHPQPWHGSSTFTHEAALAVARVAPQAFWPYSLALFKAQQDFFDIPSSNLTAVQIREKLVALATDLVDKNQIEEIAELLKLKSTPNGGVAVTEDLKYNIKYSRQNSIHVSPTVLFDGLIVGEVSSSWGEKEWNEFLEKRVTA